MAKRKSDPERFLGAIERMCRKECGKKPTFKVETVAGKNDVVGYVVVRGFRPERPDAPSLVYLIAEATKDGVTLVQFMHPALGLRIFSAMATVADYNAVRSALKRMVDFKPN